MRIVPTHDAVFPKIEESLGARKDDTQLEVLAGIDCDDEDLSNQRDAGDDDPIATIELIVQWLPETGEGILDWFYVRESGIDSDPPEIQHGGPLLAFNSQGQEPDLDLLIENAVTNLNESIAWAEFELEEDA
ncbi:MAG: hypothetical protein KJO79_03985 [Verrucomicrobiae bacterium]|nr:hypothetical protein [Verrucomicrobiae bacterium]NNJ86319.1 hypothetical protein [Akkermansiaceae bacterium]